jgi:hypothetical protein
VTISPSSGRGSGPKLVVSSASSSSVLIAGRKGYAN